MGSDDLFKKRKLAKGGSQRKHGTKQPKANSFLIVTEGEKTEPLYLEKIKKKIEDKMGGRIDIVPEIHIHGQGSSTRKLVEITEELIKKAPINYQNVWVVFDKDSFKDFDEAIRIAESKDFQVAWSNQCFEYWIYLHFAYSDSALHREQWYHKLNELFKKQKIANGKYRKNDEQLYQYLDE